jgi:hypothetical protein
VKRACALALVLAGCLVPAGASAKGGVIFDRYPDVQSVGSPMKFTVMLFDRKGVRPLITFRNATTGEVVRVRGSRSDLNGIAYGTARLPSKGPWDTLITVGGRPFLPGDAEPFRVGVGLTQTIPAANAARPVTEPPDSSTPWLWLTSAAAIGSALLVLVMRRRGRWGAA